MASSPSPDPRPAVVLHGGPVALPTLLGNGTNGTPRLPTGGKIRAGIKVLTRRAAEVPRAQAIYEQGLNQGQSFDQIERALAEACPELKSPLVPRNVPWFTVRAQDFPNPNWRRRSSTSMARTAARAGASTASRWCSRPIAGRA
jgi:hypothetical protein